MKQKKVSKQLLLGKHQKMGKKKKSEISTFSVLMAGAGSEASQRAGDHLYSSFSTTLWGKPVLDSIRVCSIMSIHPITSLAFAANLSSMKSYEGRSLCACNVLCIVGAAETTAGIKKCPPFSLYSHQDYKNGNGTLKFVPPTNNKMTTCTVQNLNFFPLEFLWQELW